MPNTESTTRFVGPWWGLKTFLISFAISFAGTLASVLIFSFLLGLLHAGESKESLRALARDWQSILILGGAMSGMLLEALYVGLLARHCWKSGEAQVCGLLPVPGRDARIGMLTGPLLACLFLTLQVLLISQGHKPEGGQMSKAAMESGIAMSCWLVIALLIAPWMEEVLFRGFLYGGLQRRWDWRLAAGLVTVLFAGLHYGEIAKSPAAALSVFSLGCLTMVLRIRTGSVVPGILAHLGYNGVIGAVAALGFSLSSK